MPCAACIRSSRVRRPEARSRPTRAMGVSRSTEHRPGRVSAFERRGVDDRLERGSGLPSGLRRPVERALIEVPAADERERRRQWLDRWPRGCPAEPVARAARLAQSRAIRGMMACSAARWSTRVIGRVDAQAAAEHSLGSEHARRVGCGSLPGSTRRCRHHRRRLATSIRGGASGSAAVHEVRQRAQRPRSVPASRISRSTRLRRCRGPFDRDSTVRRATGARTSAASKAASAGRARTQASRSNRATPPRHRRSPLRSTRYSGTPEGSRAFE